MSTQGFDASSVKRSTWIAGGGAVVLLISTFFSWWKVSALGFSVNASGWDTGALGKLVFFVALIAVALVVVDHMKVDVSQLPVPVPLALLGAGALSVLLVVDPLHRHPGRRRPGLGHLRRADREPRTHVRRLAQAARGLAAHASGSGAHRARLAPAVQSELGARGAHERLQRTGEALVVAHVELVVPLQADGEGAVRRLGGLDRAVGRDGGGAQAVAQPLDRLVVVGVDDLLAGAEPLGQARALEHLDLVHGSARPRRVFQSPMCSMSEPVDGTSWTSVPPAATLSTWLPRQIPSTGLPSCRHARARPSSVMS